MGVRGTTVESGTASCCILAGCIFLRGRPGLLGGGATSLEGTDESVSGVSTRCFLVLFLVFLRVEGGRASVSRLVSGTGEKSV